MTDDKLDRLRKLAEDTQSGLILEAVAELAFHSHGLTKSEIDRRMTEAMFKAVRIHSDELATLKKALGEALDHWLVHMNNSDTMLTSPQYDRIAELRKLL